MTDFNMLLADIVANMTDTSLTEPFYKMVLYRLLSLGYEPTDEDLWPLCFAMQKKETHVKNFCNISEVPESAYTIVCDMVCGEFLSEMLSLGRLSDEQIEQTLQSLSLGDASMTFANTEVGSFDSLINKLLHDGEGVLVCYRKLRW